MAEASVLPQPVHLDDPRVANFLEQLTQCICARDLGPLETELNELRIRIDAIQWNPDPLSLPSPHLQQLWHFWHEQQLREVRTPIRELDIAATVPAELAPYCILVEALTPDSKDARYLYYGSAISGSVSKNWTGMRLSDMIRTGTAGLFYLCTYRASVRMNQPVYTVNISAPRLTNIFWQRLVLPWREAHGITGFLVGDIPSKTTPRPVTAHPDIHLEESLFLHSVLAESPLGVGVFINDEEFLFCNTALARLLGIPSTTLVRQRPSTLFQDRKLFQAHMQDLYEGKVITQVDSALCRADGEIIWTTLSYKRVRYSGLDAVLVWVVDVTERREMERKLRKLATLDDLTGINNRRHFFELATQELERARRHHYPCTVAVIDVDHFKNINDNYGHAAGDLALQELACLLTGQIRHGDIFGRLGGEEFGVLLSHVGTEEAYLIVERMREEVEDLIIDYQGTTLSITISVGIGPCLPHKEALDGALQLADHALYQAKALGRNQVCKQLIKHMGNGPTSA